MKKSLGARTLLVPTPVWIVGTYDKDGKANGAAVAWGGICCSKPPCVAVSLRAATYTHGCILARKAFTVNVPDAGHVKEADYFGLASGRNVDKMATAGLTTEKSEVVDAPVIVEFPLAAECRLLQVVELGLHTMFVGEIMDVKVDESVLDEGGEVSLERLDPLVYSSFGKVYYGLGKAAGPAFSVGTTIGK